MRWGRTTCPDIEGTELVYTGIAAGTRSSHSGGGSNYLCIKDNPSHLQYHQRAGALLDGTEYETRELSDEDVPCSVCYVATREAVLMIPGTFTCPTNWTREYYGYLMTEQYDSNGRTTFECVDDYPEVITGSYENKNSAQFVFVAPGCDNFCPPYIENREITCAVCTR